MKFSDYLFNTNMGITGFISYLTKESIQVTGFKAQCLDDLWVCAIEHSHKLIIVVAGDIALRKIEGIHKG